MRTPLLFANGIAAPSPFAMSLSAVRRYVNPDSAGSRSSNFSGGLVRRLGMLGLAPLDVRIELRRLAAIEPAVIAHHADPAMPQFLDAIDFLRLPGFRRLRIFPADQ